MGVDSAMFWEHVESPAFQAGLDNGYWSLLQAREEVEWPIVMIAVKAAVKDNCPDQYVFRFDLSGYPQQAPTACLWDMTNNSPLEPGKWPRGGQSILKVFNPGWKRDALYAPCDRKAMEGHESWREPHRGLWWEATFSIVVYLQFIHRLINSGGYLYG